MNILKFKPETVNVRDYLNWALSNATLKNAYTDIINSKGNWVEDEAPYITHIDMIAPNRNKAAISINASGLTVDNQSINTNHYFGSTINDINDRLNQMESQINILLRTVNEQNNNSK